MVTEPSPRTERRRSLLTLEEVADRLSVARSTVYKMVRDAGLPAINVGLDGRPNYRVTEEALAAWIQARTTSAAGRP